MWTSSKYNPGFDLREISAGYDIQSPDTRPVIVEKSSQIIRILNNFCPGEGGESYLSPSALNTYIDCPLKFYFRYVAGIRETRAWEEYGKGG